MNMRPHLLLLSVLSVVPMQVIAAPAATDTARDRASILAMKGEYIVDFAFDETVLLQPGYERHPAMRSGGNEVVAGQSGGDGFRLDGRRYSVALLIQVAQKNRGQRQVSEEIHLVFERGSQINDPTKPLQK